MLILFLILVSFVGAQGPDLSNNETFGESNYSEVKLNLLIESPEGIVPEAPVEMRSIESSSSIEETPVPETPVENSIPPEEFIEEISIPEAPVEMRSVDDASGQSEELSTEETLIHGPVPETPVEEMSVPETPVEEMSVPETPVEGVEETDFLLLGALWRSDPQYLISILVLILTIKLTGLFVSRRRLRQATH